MKIRRWLNASPSPQSRRAWNCTCIALLAVNCGPLLQDKVMWPLGLIGIFICIPAVWLFAYDPQRKDKRIKEDE